MSGPPHRRVLMIEQGGRGGVADYTGELVRALVDLGWAVELASADDHLYPPIPGVVVHPVFHYMRDDTALRRALRRAHLGPVVNGLRFLASLPQLVRLSKNADIVHSQGWEIPEIGLVAIVCMRVGGATIVQTLHGIVERSGRLTRTRRLITRAKGWLTAGTIVHTRGRCGAATARYACADGRDPTRRVRRARAHRGQRRARRCPRTAGHRSRGACHADVRPAARRQGPRRPRRGAHAAAHAAPADRRPGPGRAHVRSPRGSRAPSWPVA